jgi:hypothetical protein
LRGALPLCQIPVSVQHEKTELTKTRLRCFKGVLQDLETYVPSQSTSIINYAVARRLVETITTATT